MVTAIEKQGITTEFLGFWAQESSVSFRGVRKSEVEPRDRLRQKLVPLLSPLYLAILEATRQSGQWLMDETRWEMFFNVEGKAAMCWSRRWERNQSVIRRSNSDQFVPTILLLRAVDQLDGDRFGGGCLKDFGDEVRRFRAAL